LSASVTGIAARSRSTGARSIAGKRRNPAASRNVRIAAKLGGLVPISCGGRRVAMPLIERSATAFALSFNKMSISGDDTENAVSRIGQSTSAFAIAGVATSVAAINNCFNITCPP
jgi:hypothetical protein